MPILVWNSTENGRFVPGTGLVCPRQGSRLSQRRVLFVPNTANILAKKISFVAQFYSKNGPKRVHQNLVQFLLYLFPSNLLHFSKKGPKRCSSFENRPKRKHADWSKGYISARLCMFIGFFLPKYRGNRNRSNRAEKF